MTSLLPSGLPGVDPRGVDPAAANPLRGLRWYVDPVEPAYRSYRTFVRKGRRHAAALMWRIAREPRFRWFGRWDRPVRRRVRNYLRCAAAVQPGAVPLMVVMRHQGKGCGGGYTGGGAAEDRRTRAWYRSFARAVGGTRVVIGFEPDSLGTLECLAAGRRRARLQLLRYGVDVLSRLPRATIYLEAGASDWESARRTAKQLRYIGIRKVRGFMLNATHHDWTRPNIRHGLAISRRVGGKHFIVNTSYNGRGPIHIHVGRRTRNVWCNPPNRGLGPEPTTATGNRLVDAYMWINRPGYSAGACNGGPLPVGSWWPERALMYARYATNWLSPPRGTRNGFFR
jgi:endoglucanase